MGKRLDNNEFIKRAKKIHGDKYNYSKIDYEKYNKHVKIICPIHGEFLQTPSNHLHKKKYGCNKCGNESSVKENTQSINCTLGLYVLSHQHNILQGHIYCMH